MVEDCVFCGIVRGDIPSRKVFEDEDFIAIMDITPYVRGHLMVIPKNHSKWVWDIKDKDYIKYILVVKKIAKVLRKAFDTDCVMEIIAGWGVTHSHIHLLPRIKGDGLGEIPCEPLKGGISNKEMDRIFLRIKKFIVK